MDEGPHISAESHVEQTQNLELVTREGTDPVQLHEENKEYQHTEKYVLNKELALIKKSKACDRANFEVKENRCSTTISMSTVVFKYFRDRIQNYLKSKNFDVQSETAVDREGAVVKEVI